MSIRRASALALFAASFALPASSADLEVRRTAGAAEALDGRLLVVFATDGKQEPRFQVEANYRSAQVFGLDVAGLGKGQLARVDAAADGHPLRRLSDVAPGTYWVQAVLHRYERVTPAHGHSILVPWDGGEGQQWNSSPGNLFSKPVEIRWDGKAALRLELTEEIPPIAPPLDTAWIKHVTVKSERLSRFWGREVSLTAHVLLPRDFDRHADARYPVMIFHGHFPSDLSGFRPEAPDPKLECQPSERFHLPCYNRDVQTEAHRFFGLWNSPDFPRFLVVEIQHPTPFYDDSYAVNSDNNGPYGDAITYELLPEIERRYRGIGAGWGRFVYGGSTGGWEALAVQVFYPREYNGAFGACPDPVDFRSMMLVDLTKDDNAYRRKGPFGAIEIPSHRDWLGQINTTMELENGMERALGSKGRSGGQWDGWQSVYSPVGADGYPAAIFDKATGAIDPSVAKAWRERYDLRFVLERDWAKLAADLRGKLFVFVGDMDNYYLNDAVYQLEEFLRRADPPADAEVAYGDRFEHCWNGDPNLPNAVSRLRYNELYLDRIARRLQATAPAGSGVEAWRRGGLLQLR
jgi:hypothetical protein